MMNKKLIPLTTLVIFIVQIGNAQKPIKILQPKSEFDVKQATEMLNEGKSQIKGSAYYEAKTIIGIKSGETVFARKDAIVSLYPLTKYLEEYLNLKKQNKEGKQIAAINPLAASFRIECKIYSEMGEFLFVGLSPGKYYLESVVTFPSGLGGKEVADVIEIKSNGEVVNCKLTFIYRGGYNNNRY